MQIFKRSIDDKAEVGEQRREPHDVPEDNRKWMLMKSQKKRSGTGNDEEDDHDEEDDGQQGRKVDVFDFVFVCCQEAEDGNGGGEMWEMGRKEAIQAKRKREREKKKKTKTNAG